MKIFNDDTIWCGKVNFVDDNNVLVGFDNSRLCCEVFGWTVSYTDDDKISTHKDESSINTGGYNFDTTYFKQGDACVTFRLTKMFARDIFLTLWNIHNGYYSHGFEFKSDSEIFREGSL